MALVATFLMRVVAELFIGCGLLGYLARDGLRAILWR
jgi:hypothetical protein